MAKKIRVYAKEWRQYKEMTLERASERSGISQSYLHDLENGHPKKRWSIVHLEALAHAYGLDDPQDLLWNPLIGGPPLWRIVKGIGEKDRDQAAKILETFVKKTGTEGR